MRHLNEEEKTAFRMKMIKAIDKFLAQELTDSHEVGYIGDNTVYHMADAALLVMYAINDVNVYIEESK